MSAKQFWKQVKFGKRKNKTSEPSKGPKKAAIAAQSKSEELGSENRLQIKLQAKMSFPEIYNM